MENFLCATVQRNEICVSDRFRGNKNTMYVILCMHCIFQDTKYSTKLYLMYVNNAKTMLGFSRTL